MLLNFHTQDRVKGSCKHCDLTSFFTTKSSTRVLSKIVLVLQLVTAVEMTKPGARIYAAQLEILRSKSTLTMATRGLLLF